MWTSSRIRKIAVITGKGCLWSLVVLAGIIGFLFAVHWFTSKESVSIDYQSPRRRTPIQPFLMCFGMNRGLREHTYGDGRRIMMGLTCRIEASISKMA